MPSFSQARRTLANLWAGPADLPRNLKLERRLVLGRWLAIGFFAPALALYHLPERQEREAFGLLGVAVLYNLALTWLIKRRFHWVRDGSLPTFGDGMLCAALIVIVGGFESPFYVILY